MLHGGNVDTENIEIGKAERAWINWKILFEHASSQGDDFTIDDIGLKSILNRFRDLATIKSQCSILVEILIDDQPTSSGRRKKKRAASWER